MPRPAGITDEFARAAIDKALAGTVDDGAYLREDPVFLEFAVAQEWLAAELAELGCAGVLHERILFSFGQMAAYVNTNDGMWKLATDVRENYTKGKWVEPGQELADALVAKFGATRRNRAALKEMMEQAGVTKLDEEGLRKLGEAIREKLAKGLTELPGKN